MGKSVLCAGSCLRLFDVCVWSMRAISKKYSRASGYHPWPCSRYACELSQGFAHPRLSAKIGVASLVAKKS